MWDYRLFNSYINTGKYVKISAGVQPKHLRATPYNPSAKQCNLTPIVGPTLSEQEIESTLKNVAHPEDCEGVESVHCIHLQVPVRIRL